MLLLMLLNANILFVFRFKCAQKASKTGYFFTSLRHGIYFVGFSSKYYYTSSLCRLVSTAPETFSAGPT